MIQESKERRTLFSADTVALFVYTLLRIKDLFVKLKYRIVDGKSACVFFFET